MFPAGKLLFLRPIKRKVVSTKKGEDDKLEQAWDAVWQTPEEVIAEGILVSKKVFPDADVLTSEANVTSLCFCSWIV